MAAASDFESLARQYWAAWGDALRDRLDPRMKGIR